VIAAGAAPRRAARLARSSARFGAPLVITALALACSFDPAYRDIVRSSAPLCAEGARACIGGNVSRCVGEGDAFRWEVEDDCGGRGQVCVASFVACRPCIPGARRCDGPAVQACTGDGSEYRPVETCNADEGDACRGGACVNLCRRATENRSNEGCEYWAVDLDNAVVSVASNAAAQQFAVVVSNVQPDVPARVVVEEDNGEVGGESAPRVVARATVPQQNLEVFRLGPREVDGSPPGTFNRGTGTALTRNAYRIRSNVPIVAYQFNPLENQNVFSNDASQLLPTAALNAGSGRAYVVAGWPQTIATSDEASQNFGTDLRAFVTIVATAPDTRVRIKPTARVIPGGPFASGLAAGETAEVTLQPFEVLNLESGGFNADFSGTLVDANQPIALFSGSEASDAPFFSSLSFRSCCADHLEEQNPPVRAVGKTYALARMPNRTRAIAAAGGVVSIADEPEFYRIVATREGRTEVRTTLPAPDDFFVLEGEGSIRTLTARQDFVLDATQAVLVADVQASQEAAGAPNGVPGGDPSLVFVPPIEQWRADYIFLTPDKYAFDFVVISAPAGANVFLDGLALGPAVCDVGPTDGLTEEERGGKPPAYLSYRCQLSFPRIDPSAAPPGNVFPGDQNDGVHRVQADLPIGVVVYGFDRFVSYAYAGGTQLSEINVR
jgi:hypothetical protein